MVSFLFWNKTQNSSIKLVWFYLNKEVHGCPHAEHAAADVDHRRGVKSLLAVELHHAVVAVVGGEVEEEDDQKMIRSRHLASAGTSEVEAEKNVDETVQ